MPDAENQFLINPFGLLFRDVTAGSLVKIDLEGRQLEDSPHDVNPAGFTIHSAIHAARHDAACVLHTHTVAGVAVSTLEEGLLPLNQWSLLFHQRVAYHDFEGIALDLDERERLVADLGATAKVLILRNHGLLTVGRATWRMRWRPCSRSRRPAGRRSRCSRPGGPCARSPRPSARRRCGSLESGDGNRMKGADRSRPAGLARHALAAGAGQMTFL